jgi:transposase-like protein
MLKQQSRYNADVQRHAVEQVLCHHHSIAQVARQLHCSTQSVQRWIKRHRKSVTTSSIVPTSNSPFAFLPIQVDPPPSSSSKIELVTKNGLTLRFPGDTPADILCDIVRRLEVTSC